MSSFPNFAFSFKSREFKESYNNNQVSDTKLLKILNINATFWGGKLKKIAPAAQKIFPCGQGNSP